jgi:hypothetical protein
MSDAPPKKPALTDSPEFLERGSLLLAVLLSAFAFSMPYAVFLHRLSLQILAQLQSAISAL